MAKSNAHKFGQIIGDILEFALQPTLEKFAKKHRLFLDKKGLREARKGKKVSWTDSNGNSHDLDFVLERHGTHQKIGTPVAFIETAWRRYTKHSRNKAQEIQSAILPLLKTHEGASPFAGVVLAGEFTDGALNQLRSLGFTVLFFPYSTIIQAFQEFGIDAKYDETTEEADFAEKIKLVEGLTDKILVALMLADLNKKEVEIFFDSLAKSVSRFIEQVVVLPLYGAELQTNTIQEAIEFLGQYRGQNSTPNLVRFEILIRYNTGDKIEASFQERQDAISFLKNYT